VSLSLTGTYTPAGGPIVITVPGIAGEVITPSTTLPLGNISTGTLTDPTDLANFTGTGLESFLLSGLAPVTYTGHVSNGYNASLGGTTDAGGYATVTYNYSDGNTPGVPEPGTIALFGLGLAGIGFVRRRHQRL